VQATMSANTTNALSFGTLTMDADTDHFRTDHGSRLGAGRPWPGSRFAQFQRKRYRQHQLAPDAGGGLTSSRLHGNVRNRFDVGGSGVAVNNATPALQQLQLFAAPLWVCRAPTSWSVALCTALGDAGIGTFTGDVVFTFSAAN
jgi:hypothetical protein